MPPASPSHLLASSLADSWRAEAAPYAGTAEELAVVAPLLLASGAAALAWRRVRRSSLKSHAAARKLQEAQRLNTINAALRERELEEVFQLLDAANVRALLVKGWASSLAYTEAGLRPSGDVDVCVRPVSFERARRALEGSKAWVDLHESFGEDDVGDFDEIYARARTFTLGSALLRVPSEEDHLRLLCLHLLRHGAWRPLWLCDVAAALEGRSEQFDWQLFMGDDPKRARWVACAVGLAHKLLDARTADTPFARASDRLPRWLLPEVLKQWERPYATSHGTPRHRAPMREYLSRPRGVLGDLLNRWPNPIEATVRVGGPFNAWPRWPFQLANCLARTTRFLASSRHAATE